MTVSSLIEQLQNVLQDHGNLPVYVESEESILNEWFSQDIAVFVDTIIGEEADPPQSEADVVCVKIGHRP